MIIQGDTEAAKELAALIILHDYVLSAQDRQTNAVMWARSAGASWREIGDALGISRQAATDRYRDTCG